MGVDNTDENDSLTNLLPPVKLAETVIQSGSVTHIDQLVEIPPTVTKNKNEKKKSNEDVVLVDTDVIEYIDKKIESTALPEEEEKSACSSVLKVMVGIIIVVFISISWTGATQFGKSTYSAHFKAPFFTTWFTTCFMIVIYPIFMVPLLCKKTPFRLRTFLRESAEIFGARGFCLQSLLCFLLRIILPFCCTWLLTNYFYFRSLEVLLPGSVTAVFSSSSCFVYILSLLFLKDTFYFIRFLSVAISIGGIVLIGYVEGFGTSSTTGIIFVLCAALGSSIYQVMFKRILGDASGSQVALFLTLLGIINALLFWPILFLLDHFKYETLDWQMMPWLFLIGTGLMGAIFNYLVNFGISLTYPLFISVGILLGVPLSSIVDAIFRNSLFNWVKVVAVAMVLLGFLLMLIPNEKLDIYERRKCSKKEINEV